MSIWQLNDKNRQNIHVGDNQIVMLVNNASKSLDLKYHFCLIGLKLTNQKAYHKHQR